MKNWLRQLKRGEKFDLSYVLSRAMPSAPLNDRILWLEQLVDWLRSDEELATKAVRVRFLLQLLDRNPEWKQKSAEVICSILLETAGMRLFTETGVPSWSSFIQEFLSRLVKVFLPKSAHDSSSLQAILEQVFYDDRDAEWITAIPLNLREDIFTWISQGIQSGSELKRKILIDLINAGLVLTIKSASITIREDFAIRSPECNDLIDHPVLRLEQQLIRLRRAIDGHEISGTSSAEFQEIRAGIHQSLEQTRDISRFVKQHLESHGVSVDLVFQRDRLKLYVERIAEISKVIFSVLEHSESRKADGFEFFSTLVQGSSYDRDFSYILKKNFSLISRKIVDFTGSTGETYIAQNRADYSHLFWYAAGGGFLTAFTVVIKYAVTLEGWPMFIELFYSFLNYSTSFLVMHFLHFKLATKQPSMTAAALASKLKADGGESDDEMFVDEIAKISRSQFASVLGNLAAVIPTALMIDYLWLGVHGTHYLDTNHALYVLHSIQPLHTLTIVYAAMTGVLLWISGLTSGWIENGAVYYQVPDLIRNHKVLKKLLGVDRTRRIADAFLRNISGITSAVSLGFYLALWPVLGKFFGLPFDIRHITLTTGAVSMALQSIGFSSVTAMQWVSIVSGIAVIGMMNFSVSFVLATLVAVRAKEVSARRTLSIFKKAFQRWVKSPLQFMLPRE